MTNSTDGVSIPLDPGWAEIRDVTRALCARFPGEYWRGLDRERAYPTSSSAR